MGIQSEGEQKCQNGGPIQMFKPFLFVLQIKGGGLDMHSYSYDILFFDTLSFSDVPVPG